VRQSGGLYLGGLNGSMLMPSRPVTPGPQSVARPKSPWRRRAMRWAAANPILAALAIAGMAAGAITVTYTTASTLTTTVTPPPIQFLVGDDTGSLSDYVTALSISTNKTYLTTTVKGVPEATLSVGSFFKLENVDDEAHTVTLSSANVTNSLVSIYTIEIYDESDALVDTLDLREAAGTVTAQATMPAGDTFYTKLTLRLATTAGANNVDLSNAITLTFT